MKKLLLSVIVGISFLGTSRSFAAGEGLGYMPGQRHPAARMTSVESAVRVFTDKFKLSRDHQIKFIVQLSTIADEQGKVEIDLARDIAKQIQAMPAVIPAAGEAEVKESEARIEPQKVKTVKKAEGMQAILDLLAKQKGVQLGSDVQKHIGGFLPSNYPVVEWNLKFPEGKTVLEFFKMPLEYGYKQLAISPDGKYIALAMDSSKLLVWDMLKGSQAPKTVIVRDGYNMGEIAFGPAGKLGYVFTAYYKPHGSYGGSAPRRMLGVIDVATGKELWREATVKRDPRVSFSVDGNYVIEVARNSQNDPVVREVSTGKRVDMQVSSALPKYGYSLDGTTRARRDQKKGVIILEKAVGDNWEKYESIPFQSKWDKEKDVNTVICLSPHGLRLGVVQSKGSEYVVHVYDAQKRWRTLEEADIRPVWLRWLSAAGVVRLSKTISRDTGFTLIRDRNIGSLSLHFSPSGRHLLLLFYSYYDKTMVCKMYDIFKLFGGVDEYEEREAKSRAESKARMRAWEMEKSGAQEF